MVEDDIDVTKMAWVNLSNPEPQSPILLRWSGSGHTDWSMPSNTGTIEWSEIQGVNNWDARPPELTDTYTEIRTQTPPVLAIEDGVLVVKVSYGTQTIVAPIGDGQWFFGQLVDKLINPALSKAYQTARFERAAASPND